MSKDEGCEQLLAEFKKFADKGRTHVREARERPISLLGTDRGVEELVRRAENVPGRRQHLFGWREIVRSSTHCLSLLLNIVPASGIIF